VKTRDETPAKDAFVAEPLVVFVHIRKTAGTTVRRIIQRQYQRRNTRMVRNYFVEPDRSLEMTQAFATETPRGVRAVHGHMLFTTTGCVSAARSSTRRSRTRSQRA
jgi:hypothetical protein